MKSYLYKKLDILILIPSSYGGGAERLVLDQMKNSKQDNINYHVLSLRKGDIEEDFSKFSFYKTLNSRYRLSLKTIASLNSFVRKNNIKIIHCHLLEAASYGFLIKMINPRIKLICTRHVSNDPLRKKLILRLFIKIISLNNNLIIAVSKDVKKFTVKNEWIKPSKIEVIYNGVDTKRFQRVDTKKIKEELNISNNDFLIGVVGRLIEQKGHIYLLEAIKNLKKKIPNIRLLVAGEGNLEKELKALCNKMSIIDNVSFLGFRKDLPEIYSALDVFCLPSLFEGFGLVIVEAMLCKTPVIATELDCIKEIATNEQEAILVQPKNPKDLEDALFRVYRKNYNLKMVENAYIKSKQLFDYQRNLEALEDKYEEMMK